MKLKIAVFCSSSQELEPKYYNTASKVGQLIAENNYDLIYGGTDVGMMKSLSESAKTHNAHITGVIPEVINDQGIASTICDTIHLTANMQDRKQLMTQLANTFIALPGGFGTLEEFTEVLTAKQLGLHNKPIILLNTDGFFDPLIQWFNQLYSTKMANEVYRNLFTVLNSETQIIPHLAAVEAVHFHQKHNS